MQNYSPNLIRQSRISNLLCSPAVMAGFEVITRAATVLDDEVVRICEIPAPPFQEAARAAYVRQRFEHYLRDVGVDAEGNVIARVPGQIHRSAVVISAHLDTVFPEGTNVTVRRNGRRLYAPGISDNACGMAGLISLARILSEAAIAPKRNVYLVATVGEEGAGNLRGVRHLFSDEGLAVLGGPDGIDAFVSLDGPGLERITHRALGSRRYRVTISGPGGHSWGDFGIVNPVHALGRAIARLSAYPAPISPRTSYNVGIIEGGQSVNAIPETASMSVDIRSTSAEEINKLEAYLKKVVDIAVREETAMRSLSGTHLSAGLEMIGDRPSGEVPIDSEIVQAALQCSRVLGLDPRLDCSSTDSNIPISLGIPAITIGVGGLSGNCHSLNEWYEPTGKELGLQRLLLLTLALAGVSTSSELEKSSAHEAHPA